MRTRDGLRGTDCALFNGTVPGNHLEVLSAKSWQVGLRKTDNPGTARGCDRRQAIDACEPVLERGCDVGRGEGDEHLEFWGQTPSLGSDSNCVKGPVSLGSDSNCGMGLG